ncbi:MAG: SpoIVB peptidase [Clostridiales bacterium]|nr:SpoIVB peptidase [Clostridiales bacterium]
MFLNKLRKFFAVPPLILCAITIYFTIQFLNIPSEIKLTRGESRLDFSLPISAVIETGSIEALKVNQLPVSENINVSLGSPVTIEAEETGKAGMLLNFFGLPLKKVVIDVTPDIELVPCGMAIGVRINTNGVMVLGTGAVEGGDGTSHNPSYGILKSGDLILNANGSELSSKEELIRIINESEDVKLRFSRKGEVLEATVTPVKNVSENENKIGVWIRDSTQGIGTITYYNPANGKFAALGHGILDVDTKQLMVIKSGEIMESEITSVKKGGKGSPGELIGEIKRSRVYGKITDNRSCGIYGTLDFAALSAMPAEKMKVGFQSMVHEGPAVIRSNVSGREVRDYDVYIETVNRYSGDSSRGMVIRITDPELLRQTNGIVQGMSGSPIIQGGRLIGAVTHVFVQDPAKGYGIFIENMLN